MTLSSDIYGRTVTVEQDVDGQDVYTITDTSGNEITVSFPTGTATSVVYSAINSMQPSDPDLMQAKLLVSNNFSNAMEDYVCNIYSLETQFRFLMLYYIATQTGLTNRAAYLYPVFTWVTNLIAYAGEFESSITAMTGASEVLATTWDFTNGGANPAPTATLLGAVLIST